MNSRFFKPMQMAVLLWLAFVAAGPAAEPAQVRVPLAELPAPAQKAIQAQAADGQLGEILRGTEDGETTYDVEVTKDRHTRSYTVNERGELLAEEVFLSELTPRLQRAIRAQVGKSHPESILKCTDEGEVTYDVEFTREGKARELTLSPTGRLLRTKLFLDELSAELQAAITKAAGAATVESIYKNSEDDEVLYEVEVKQASKTRTLSFDTKSNLVSEEEPVALSDAPAAVQQALAAQLPSGAKLLSLDKTTEDGQVTYDAQILRAGKTQSLTLSSDGKLQP